MNGDLRIFMAIGVFIAPNLLYWEALSSAGHRMQYLPLKSPRGLPRPHVSPFFAVCSTDHEKAPFHLQQLVLIGRPRRNAAQCVAQVLVVQGLACNRPTPREF